MQRITPFLWFDGQAEQAAKFYTSIFKGSKIVSTSSMSATFRLDGRDFIAFDGGPAYRFTPAISLFVSCKTQKEIDYYWRKLSAGGEIVRCGWLKDKFGVSWQIVPSILGDLLGDPDEEKAGRAMEAMLKMKKLEIATLKRAHAGKARH
jgi:predicted 3-demethylubiquinone-9 3-methyltransferase (glyoxalase superfamily)